MVEIASILATTSLLYGGAIISLPLSSILLQVVILNINSDYKYKLFIVYNKKEYSLLMPNTASVCF